MWVDDESAALLTDLYELTMLQAYLAEGMNERAAFSLFFRRLPTKRAFAVACGLDDALSFLEQLSFSRRSLDELARLGIFTEGFLRSLEGLCFTGDVYAVPEGTVVFPDEPLLEIVAPLVEAQLVETMVINQLHLETVLASKAARVVIAARGKRVVDFGLRRIHGADAGLKSARAFYIAGLDATSNVLAGARYGVPVTGTMAHSYVEAHASELDAFRAFAAQYPETVLLVDTYDTLAGVDAVIALARELGPARFCVKAVRLDSGDLDALARAARNKLDGAGLARVGIFASGGLDEHRVAALVDAGAPIDGFGVGTAMGASDDAPTLDMAYKLVEYAGVGRMKSSAQKATLPGRKQVFRGPEGDVIARFDEALPGRALLEPVMLGGVRTAAGRRTLDEARARAREEIAALPARLRTLNVVEPPYPVTVSERLRADRDRLVEERRRR